MASKGDYPAKNTRKATRSNGEEPNCTESPPNQKSTGKTGKGRKTPINKTPGKSKIPISSPKPATGKNISEKDKAKLAVNLRSFLTSSQKFPR